MRKALFLAFLVGLFASTHCQDTEVIDFHTDISIGGGYKYVSVSYTIQVNTQKGYDFNPIRIHFSKNAPIYDVDVRLETLRGKVIRKVKKGEMKDYSAVSEASFYEDDMFRRIPVANNSYPYRISCSYKQRFKEFLTIARWDPYIRYSLPLKHASLSLTVPYDYKLHIREQDIQQSSEEIKGSSKRLVWESGPLEKIESEALGPHYRTMVPGVHIVPEEFKYGVRGRQESWEEFGNWEYRLNEGRDELPESEELKIRELLDGIRENREKVRILYHHMQDFTRYINVSIDIGGFQTYPASYVCKNGYGDCKALSNYMLALLTHAGIRAFPALVYAGSHPPPFFEDFPSNQFNHVMVCVPLEKDTLWLECTDPHAPMGYTSSFTQNRPALLVDKERSRLVRTPALFPSEIRTTRCFEFTYSRYAEPLVSLRSELRGREFEYIRSMNNELESREKEDYIRDFLGVSETSLDAWSLEDQQRDSSAIFLEAKFKGGDFFSRMGAVTLVHPPAFRMPDMEKPSERKQAVHVASPYYRTDSLLLHYPESVSLSSLPADTILVGPLGRYERKLENKKGTLVLVRSFKIPARHLEKEFYPWFYEFIESIAILEKEQIRFKETQNPLP
jgi:Domain of Unknown Function with PDB structure (DUF3857)